MSLSTFILKKVFATLAKPGAKWNTRVQFANGQEYKNYRDNETQDLGIVFRTYGAQWRTIFFLPTGFFDAYIDETVDLEGENPIHKIAQLGHDSGLEKNEGWVSTLFSASPLVRIVQWLQERRQDNSDREQAIENADFHYALPVELFQYKLGETIGYSEGYWADGTETLNQAKHNIYEYICQKLWLKPGMRVLEVGSGWGFLPIYMVKHYDVDVVIYNPVKAQNEYMRERFRRHGVDHRIRLEYGAHRDIVNETEQFDRFVSIGVHEHHGYRKRMYRLWWKCIHDVLKDRGIGVISTSSFTPYGMTSYLTLRYIWPGGHIPSIPLEMQVMHQEGLTLLELENLWPHYYKTLMLWRDRFKQYWPEIQASHPEVFTERFRRRWTMYLEAVPETFEDGLDNSHLLFSKGRYPDVYPMTRDGKHIYSNFKRHDDQVECYE